MSDQPKAPAACPVRISRANYDRLKRVAADLGPPEQGFRRTPDQVIGVLIDAWQDAQAGQDAQAEKKLEKKRKSP